MNEHKSGFLLLPYARTCNGLKGHCQSLGVRLATVRTVDEKIHGELYGIIYQKEKGSRMTHPARLPDFSSTLLEANKDMVYQA